MLLSLFITVVGAKFIPYVEMNFVDEHEHLKAKFELQVRGLDKIVSHKNIRANRN